MTPFKSDRAKNPTALSYLLPWRVFGQVPGEVESIYPMLIPLVNFIPALKGNYSSFKEHQHSYQRLHFFSIPTCCPLKTHQIYNDLLQRGHFYYPSF